MGLGSAAGRSMLVRSVLGAQHGFDRKELQVGSPGEIKRQTNDRVKVKQQ